MLFIEYVKELSDKKLYLLFHHLAICDLNGNEILEGMGSLTQESDSLILTFIIKESQYADHNIDSIASDYNNEKSKYMINGQDSKGDNWILKTDDLYASMNFSESTVIYFSVPVSKLIQNRNMALNDTGKFITFYFHPDYSFPCNRIDKSKLNRKNPIPRTVVDFKRKGIRIKGEKRNPFWVLHFSLDEYPEKFEIRILEALKFITSQQLYPFAYTVFRTEKIENVLFPFGHSSLYTSVLPPIFILHGYYSPKQYNNSWTLFLKYLRYIASFKGDAFTPLGVEISTFIGLGRAFFETKLLNLSVRIEGILNLLYENFASLTSNEKKKITVLIKYVENFEDNELGGRLLGTINNFYKPRAKDKLFKLVKKGIINSEHFKIWDKIRNSSAHADSNKDDKWRRSAWKNYCVLLDLFYRLILNKIGYSGDYTFYSEKERKLVKFAIFKNE